jgi:hypothetical protein
LNRLFFILKCLNLVTNYCLNKKLLCYMGIVNVTWCILIIGLGYDCVQNIDAYEFKIIHYGVKFLYCYLGYVHCSQMDTFVTLSHVTMWHRYQFVNNI